MKIDEITDGESRLEFYNDVGTPNAKDHFSYVVWTWRDLIRRGDFVPEIINNIRGGVIDGKYPPSVNAFGIIGYVPAVDTSEFGGDSTKPNFYGGRLHECKVTSPLSRQVWWSNVNEFYRLACGPHGEVNPDRGDNQLDISVNYELIGGGALKIEVYVLGANLPKCIHNIHMLNLVGQKQMEDIRYFVSRRTPFGLIIESQVFPSVPEPLNIFRLFDPEPKAGFPIGEYFECPGSPDWYLLDPSHGIPRIVGMGRVSDGAGVLCVHGQLPAGSQPTIIGLFSLSEGYIPIYSQFAYTGFTDRTTSRWKLFFIPFTAETYWAACQRATGLADYSNPVAIVPWEQKDRHD